MTDLTALSRTFRKSPTPAEKALWAHIRKRQLLGYKFRRQYIIHRYIVDFICISKKLIIELDGEQHLDKIEYDQVRTEYLTNRGYKELRFWNHEVFDNVSGVINIILKHLQCDDERGRSPSESSFSPNLIGEKARRSASVDEHKRGNTNVYHTTVACLPE